MNMCCIDLHRISHTVRPIKISKTVFDGLVDSISKVKKLKDIYITSAHAISNAELKRWKSRRPREY